MGRLGVAALAAIAAAPLASAAELTITPAWNGWSRSEATSEIDVAVPAAAAANNYSGGIQLEGANGWVLSAGPAAVSGATHRWRLAVPTQGEITVSSARDVTEPLTARHAFKMSEQPLIAWIEGGLPTSAAPVLPGFRIEPMSVAAVPRIASSYSAVSGIVVSGAALTQLDDQQLLALLDHLRRCGWAYVAAAAPEAQAILTRAAGCAGRNLAIATTWPDATALADALQRRDPLSLPEPGRLAALADRNPAWAGLGAALLAYAIGMLVLLTSNVRVRWLLAAPLAAGVVAIAWLALSPARFTLAVWAESDANDTSARYSALLAGHGTLPREDAVTLPPVIGAGALLAPPADTTLRWDSVQHRFTGASLQGRLFTESRMQFQGSFPLTERVSIERESDQTLVLHNRRPSALTGAWLLFQGRQFLIENLPPNKHARLRLDAGLAPQGAAQQLAAERLAHDEAGLLMPLDLAAIGRADSLAAGPGFLLVRRRFTATTL